MLEGKKVYLQPMDMLLNSIHDVRELQKGRSTLCDSSRGLVGFRVTMYESEWEYLFTVTDIGWNRSGVTIRISEDAPCPERLIDHEFALLDYALIDRAKIELAEVEEHNRSVMAEREAQRGPSDKEAD